MKLVFCFLCICAWIFTPGTPEKTTFKFLDSCLQQNCGPVMNKAPYPANEDFTDALITDSWSLLSCVANSCFRDDNLRKNRNIWAASAPSNRWW
ncbi:unnamed protein product [Cyprideis torosa]|uniref:Uncharacterized protein n=1 Tax=Cyprideis torosa TaxID=163714 RepID=A0A7R8WSU7_9CRUS|nr:unnamed protein product [Cyprideis torosa]CAG0905501.1 unnamed protein product [Cyprideis torosa]